jgi:hypothetical protein
LLAAWGWERALGHWRHAPKLWAGLVGLALSIAVITDFMVESVTRDRYTTDIAPTLACLKQPGDTIVLVGGYPYDLPFLIRADKQMVVVQDWPTLRKTTGDNWRRELFEGANFDAAAGKVLKTPEYLPAASQLPGHWLVAPRLYASSELQGWMLVQHGVGWSLYRSTPPGVDMAPVLARCAVAVP